MKKVEITRMLGITQQALWNSGNKPSPSRFYYRILRIIDKDSLRYFLNDSNFKGIDPLNEAEAREALFKIKGKDNV